MRWSYFFDEIIRILWEIVQKKIQRSIPGHLAIYVLRWILFRLGEWGVFALFFLISNINNETCTWYKTLDQYITPSNTEWIISISILFLCISLDITDKYLQRKAGKFVLGWFTGWFFKQYDRYFDSLFKRKYKPALHVDSALEMSEIDTILIGSNILNELNSTLSELRLNYGRKLYKIESEIEELNQLILGIEELNKYSVLRINLIEHKSKIKFYNKVLIHQIRRAHKKSLHSINYDTLTAIKASFKQTVILIDEMLGDLHNVRSTISMQDVQKEFDYTTDKLYNLKKTFSSFSNIIENIEKIKNNVLHIHGSGGVGKTHVLAHIAQTRISNNQPIILISGTKFNNANNIFGHLKELFDISDNNTIDEVLGQLNSYAQKRKVRLPILIDGLNETLITNQGFSSIWSEHLNSFEKEFEKYPHLALITTLRSDYLDRIFPENYPKNQLCQLSGFGSEDITDEAIKLYFKEYNIVTDEVGVYPIPFYTPIYLQFFCETHSNADGSTAHVNFSDQSLYDVFRKANNNLSVEIIDKLGLDSRSNIVQTAFASLAEAMLESNSDTITYREFISRTDNVDIDREQGRIDNLIGVKILENELLFSRDENIDGTSIVKYTYQMYGGYSVGSLLLKQGKTDAELIEVLISEETDNTIKEDISKYILSERLRVGDFSGDFMEESPIDYVVDVIVNLPANVINADHERYISDLFRAYGPNRERIIYSYYLDQHLSMSRFFNAKYYAQEFVKLTQKQVDLSWTPFILENEEYFTKFIGRLLKVEIVSNSWEEYEQSFYTCINVLSSNIRGLRKDAIHALVRIGEIYPNQIVKSLVTNWNKGDVYIYEGLSIATYGVCLRKQNDDQFVNENLLVFAEELYKLQFDPTSTETVYNIIAINNARQLIILAESKGISTLTLSIRNYYRVRNYEFNDPGNWRTCTLSECRSLQPSFRSGYQHSHISPFNMDFMIYTIPRLLDGVSINQIINEKHRAVYNIYSRILQYGWDSADFEEVEFFERHSTLNDSKIDRFGKKYCWLAYFDYAGYLLNQGSLKHEIREDEYDDSHGYQTRISDEYLDAGYTNVVIQDKRFFKRKLIRFRYIRINKLILKIFGSNWTNLDQTKKLFKKSRLKQNGKTYILLNGSINHYNQVDNYAVRSTLQLGSLVVSNEFKYDIEQNISKTDQSKTQIHGAADLHNVFPGELFWSDFVFNEKIQKGSYYTGKNITFDYTVQIYDWEEYDRTQIGTVVQRTSAEQISYSYLNTIVGLLWEGDNPINFDVLSPRIARDMKLTFDVKTGQLLKSSGDNVILRLEHKNGLVDEKCLFMDEKSINEYLEKHNSFILYYCHQQTLDNELGGHVRRTNYYIRK